MKLIYIFLFIFVLTDVYGTDYQIKIINIVSATKNDNVYDKTKLVQRGVISCSKSSNSTLTYTIKNLTSKLDNGNDITRHDGINILIFSPTHNDQFYKNFKFICTKNNFTMMYKQQQYKASSIQSLFKTKLTSSKIKDKDLFINNLSVALVFKKIPIMLLDEKPKLGIKYNLLYRGQLTEKEYSTNDISTEVVCTKLEKGKAYFSNYGKRSFGWKNSFYSMFKIDVTYDIKMQEIISIHEIHFGQNFGEVPKQELGFQYLYNYQELTMTRK